MASQITSLKIVYSTVYSGADQRKHQISASLAFVRRIHRGPVNSPHKGPTTRKIFPFDDVIMWKPVHGMVSIEAEWRTVYASVNHTILGSDNGLSLVWRRAIIWPKVGLLFMETVGTNCTKFGNLGQNTTTSSQPVSQNVFRSYLRRGSNLQILRASPKV